MRNKETNYFKIGSFVVVGIALFIMAIIVFGSGKLFQKTIFIETYFNESVQGLTVGSPVKYRGMEIGYVKTINFANQIYGDGHSLEITDSSSRYIYVKMVITSDILTSLSKKELTASLSKEIKNGLRIKLALQGLTGNAYIELDYLNPLTNPPLPISWKPNDNYIPSSPSVLSEFGENLSTILDSLKQVNFNELFTNIQSLAMSTNQVIREIDTVLELNKQQANNVVSNLSSFSEQAKNYPASILFGKPPPKLNPRNL